MSFNPYTPSHLDNIAEDSRHIWKLLSYVRVLHASPDAPAVDVYLNNVVVLRNVAYRTLSRYLPLLPGFYVVKITAAGSPTPVLTRTVFVPFNTNVTLAAGNTLANLTLFVLPEHGMKFQPRKAFIRFAHLSPNAPRVDITLPDGTVLFRNIGFGEATNYIPVNAGDYTLQVRLSGTNTVVLTVPAVTLRENTRSTIFAICLAGGQPGLEALLALDREL